MKYTYFAWSADAGLMKIGMSRNPFERIKGVSNGLPIPPLSRVAVVEFGDLTEKEAHIAFEEERIAGEWFAISPDEVTEFLSDLSIELVEIQDPAAVACDDLPSTGSRINGLLGGVKTFTPSRKTKTNPKPISLDPQGAAITKFLSGKTGLSEAEIIRRALRFALPKFISKEVDLLSYGPESK